MFVQGPSPHGIKQFLHFDERHRTMAGKRPRRNIRDQARERKREKIKGGRRGGDMRSDGSVLCERRFSNVQTHY